MLFDLSLDCFCIENERDWLIVIVKNRNARATLTGRETDRFSVAYFVLYKRCRLSVVEVAQAEHECLNAFIDGVRALCPVL